MRRFLVKTTAAVLEYYAANELSSRDNLQNNNNNNNNVYFEHKIRKIVVHIVEIHKIARLFTYVQ